MAVDVRGTTQPTERGGGTTQRPSDPASPGGPFGARIRRDQRWREGPCARFVAAGREHVALLIAVAGPASAGSVERFEDPGFNNDLPDVENQLVVFWNITGTTSAPGRPVDSSAIPQPWSPSRFNR
jgi:hypothetical protein